MREISTQRQFYSLLNSDEFIDYLFEKKLLKEKPNRCKKCRKFNTFKLVKRKRKLQENENNSDSENTNFSLICSKFKLILFDIILVKNVEHIFQLEICLFFHQQALIIKIIQIC